MNLTREAIDQIQAMAEKAYLISFSSRAVSICHTEKLFKSNDAIGFSMELFDSGMLFHTINKTRLESLREP